MKTWLANLLWNALCIVSVRLHDYLFDIERAARIRFQHRERWYAYHTKAAATKNPRDDLRARWWATMFDFRTSPDDALRRGDLDPHARDVAMKAVEEARKRNVTGYHQP